MLKKLFGLSQNSRRSKREKVEHVHDVLFFVGETGFKLVDMSMHGFALKDEKKFEFALKKSYQGTLEFFDHDRCPVTFTVARITDGIIGCEVAQSQAYKDFFNDFKTQALEHKAEKKK